MTTPLPTHRLNQVLGRSAWLIIALSSSAFQAHAVGGERSRHGPPDAAFSACADQAEGAACAFEDRNHSISGACYTIHQRAVCVPPHHFKKGRDQPDGQPSDRLPPDAANTLRTDQPAPGLATLGRLITISQWQDQRPLEAVLNFSQHPMKQQENHHA